MRVEGLHGKRDPQVDTICDNVEGLEYHCRDRLIRRPDIQGSNSKRHAHGGPLLLQRGHGS